MKIYTLNLTANVQQSINVRGAFLRGLEGSAVYDLEAIAGDGRSIGNLKDFQTALAVEFKNTDGSYSYFDKLLITSATTQTIKLVVHDSFIDDNRLTGIVNITGGISSKVIAPDTKDTANTVSVGVAATLVLAAGTLRGKVILQNMSTAAIYIGVDNGVTTANGICLNASPGANQSGGMMELDANTTIYAIATAAASDLRVLAVKYSS